MDLANDTRSRIKNAKKLDGLNRFEHLFRVNSGLRLSVRDWDQIDRFSRSN
jgi:hypothetical protein